MLIDWFTVVAQIINFLILVAVLRYLLYKRIIRAIDARQASIAAEFEKARSLQAKANETEDLFNGQTQQLEQQKEEMLAKAREDAQTTRENLERQAREDIEQRRRRWTQKLDEERHAFLHVLAERAGRQVCEVSRKVLDDLADEKLERRIASLFLDRIQEMDEQDREQIAAALQEEQRAPEVYTTFELPEDQRRKITEAIGRIAGDTAQPAFNVDPGLVCGIELRAGGRSVSWNIRSYIESVQRDFEASLTEKTEERPV